MRKLTTEGILYISRYLYHEASELMLVSSFPEATPDQIMELINIHLGQHPKTMYMNARYEIGKNALKMHSLDRDAGSIDKNDLLIRASATMGIVGTTVSFTRFYPQTEPDRTVFLGQVEKALDSLPKGESPGPDDIFPLVRFNLRTLAIVTVSENADGQSFSHLHHHPMLDMEAAAALLRKGREAAIKLSLY